MVLPVPVITSAFSSTGPVILSGPTPLPVLLPLPPEQCFLDEKNASGNASDANSGLTKEDPWLTLEHAKEEFFDLLPNVGPRFADTFFVLSLLSDVDGDIRLFCGWNTSGHEEPTIDGSVGRIGGATATLTTVTPANPATPTEWRISIAGFNFAPFVNLYAEVVSGPNAGTGFAIKHDYGSGVAMITAPNISLAYGFSGPGTISSGDEIQFFTLPKFGDTCIFTGPGQIAAQMIRWGSGGLHDVQFNGTATFLDTCFFSGGFDAGIQGTPGNVTAAGCFASTNVHMYSSGFANLSYGGCNGSVVSHWGGVPVFTNFTCNEVSVEDFSNAEIVGWLATSNVTTGMSIDSGSSVKCLPGGRYFGTNVTGTKIAIAAGGSYYADGAHVPNITGAGTDSTVGGTAKAFSAWPYVELTNLAKAVQA